MKFKHILYFVLILTGLNSCKSYTGNVILKTEEGDEKWKDAYAQVIVEYPIKVGDKLQFSIFTNEGESVVDPTGILTKTNQQTGAANGQEQVNASAPSYDVLESGECIFPLIGRLKVAGLKTSQLDSVLSDKYNQFYNDIYAVSKVINKKIIVLGVKGGQILPYNHNMNLLEVLAIAGGLDDKSKGYNIRIIRGDLKDPQVKVVNLKTIKDMKSTVVSLLPDDIIYIEPIRRPATEGFRDNLYFVNILQSLVTIVLLINALN